MALKLVELYAEITAKDTGFRRSMAGIKRLSKQTEAGFKRLGASAKRMGIVLGAMGTIALVSFGKFELAMARVGALSQATGNELEILTEKARMLGKSTVFAATEAADAMSAFALAGFSVQEMLAAVGPTLDLAAAAQLSMAESAEIAAGIMRSMAIPVEGLTRVMDVIAKTFTTSMTTAQTLGQTMRMLGPIAQTSGQSLESVMATVGILGNNMIRGSMAGVQLKNVLIRLQAQPNEVAKALKKLNIEVARSDGSMRGLSHIIDDLNASMEHMGTVARSKFVALIGGMRSVAGLTILMREGGDAIREYEQRLIDSGGTNKKIADQMRDTLWGSFKLLTSAAKDLTIAVGKSLAPTMRRWAADISKMMGPLAAWVEKNAETVLSLAKWAAGTTAVVLGLTALSAVLSSLVSLYGLATAGIAAAAAATAWLSAKFVGLSAATTVAVVAVRALNVELLTMVGTTKLLTTSALATSTGLATMGTAAGTAGATLMSITVPALVALAAVLVISITAIKSARDEMKRFEEASIQAAKELRAYFKLRDEPPPGKSKEAQRLAKDEAFFLGQAAAMRKEIRMIEASLSWRERYLPEQYGGHKRRTKDPLDIQKLEQIRNLRQMVAAREAQAENARDAATDLRRRIALGQDPEFISIGPPKPLKPWLAGLLKMGQEAGESLYGQIESAAEEAWSQVQKINKLIAGRELDNARATARATATAMQTDVERLRIRLALLDVQRKTRDENGKLILSEEAYQRAVKQAHKDVSIEEPKPKGPGFRSQIFSSLKAFSDAIQTSMSDPAKEALDLQKERNKIAKEQLKEQGATTAEIKKITKARGLAIE